MDCRKLKYAAERITMPEEMKARITQNCKAHLQNTEAEPTPKAHITHFFARKSAAVLAALAICLSLTVTAFATGVLQGFFRDITNIWGSVVGTSYQQATDEISLDVSVNGAELTALITFAAPQMAPYSEAEKLGIAAYQIVDAAGTVRKAGSAESTEIVNGQAAVSIRLDDIGSGSFKLVITAFAAEKKADQPLQINGTWEYSFRK